MPATKDTHHAVLSALQDRNTSPKLLLSAVEVKCSALLQRTSPEPPSETHKKQSPQTDRHLF